MAGQNGSDDATRLEYALDRIARAARRPAPAPLPARPPAPTSQLETGAEIAARLDALMADLRAALGPDV